MPMHTIDLTYVGRGVHEELIAYVADQEGYFEDEGVHVAIRDGIRWKNERLRGGATIGLGRALLTRLTGGINWTALVVNTHRPLFWFMGGVDVKSMDDLRGRRLAVHPPHTAPGCFARIVLRMHGLDPDRDVTCVARAPGDYQMDLRRLRDGSIDAAYVGSTFRPNRSPTRRAFRCCPGSAITSRFRPWESPWTPLAFPSTTRRCRRWREPTGEPFVTIAEQPHLAVDYIASFLGRLTSEEARQYHERYIGPYFNSDGRVDLAIAQRAVDAVAAELGVASLSADQMYQPAV